MYCTSHGKGLQSSFVHVPKNPVLKDHGLQYADKCAAAVLTPNVIRAGKMGRWTNSTHVIKAVGGYTGISSSTLACDVNRTVLDERLAMAECLAMEHRPDVYNICRERFVENLSYGGEMEFNRVLKNYDSFYYDALKPHVKDAMSGATYVNVADCFRIHEQMFRRDSKKDVDVNSCKLSLTFAHSGGNYTQLQCKTSHYLAIFFLLNTNFCQCNFFL